MLALLPDDPAEQERRTREALALARASSDPEVRRWVAPLLNNLGMTLHDTGDLVAALEAFEEAVRVRTAQGDAPETAVARWMVGWTLRLLGRTDEALAIQQALAHENEEADRPDPYVHDELALLHAERGEPDLAARHDREAARLRPEG
nr:tetratricopeptide repeat protein [Ornithinimicrobium sp. F0845]